MSKEVSQYVTDVLRPQLLSFGVDSQYIEEISHVVETQMLSALQSWNQEEFRKTLMLLVSEEAPFYQPDAPLEIKSFVVLTLRNSPFESLQSKAYAETGLKHELSDAQVIRLTGDAIRFFRDYRLETLADNAATVSIENIYSNLAENYPVAWNALKELANSLENTCSFPALTRIDAEEYSTKILCLATEKTSGIRSIKDGFDKNIEPTLAQQLKYVFNSNSYFFVDCFKMLSRNPELLFSVLEFLLINSIPFVSVNYYLSNGYAEKRRNILKAAHNNKEIKKHLSNMNGISQLHRNLLTSLHESLNL